MEISLIKFFKNNYILLGLLKLDYSFNIIKYFNVH